MRALSLLLLSIPALLLPGCQEITEPPIPPDYARPLPPGELALRQLTDPARYPDFSQGFFHRARLGRAIRRSLDYLASPSSESHFPYGDITHARAVASLRRFNDILQQTNTPQELQQRVLAEYDVYQSVGYDGQGVVFFTGYYTPIFDGRAERSAKFRYPLYRLPADLGKDADGRTLGRKAADGSYTPYPTRREIEAGKLLAGQEIAWLSDPFEAYVVSVQGSARLRLEDGTLWELGYAGNNGHDYTAVGHLLVNDGHIKPDDLSLQAMIDFFHDHPELIDYYCQQNDRFVFFQETSGGPYGSIGVPVTAMRTIATDKEVYPRACLAFISAPLPQRTRRGVEIRPYAGFALDQDTGGAIRAPGRCDMYMGVGDEAADLAGRARAEGKLYYIFVKQELIRR